MASGIYSIAHTSGKVYIGSAVDIRVRLVAHRRNLVTGKHGNAKLQYAWNKYGADAFTFSTLLFCSKENLLMYEQLCIDGYDAVKSGYNIALVAGSPMLGRSTSAETKAKISSIKTGVKRPPFSDAHRAKLSAALLGNKHTLGIPLNEKQVAALLKANTGNQYTLGLRHTEETRSKMSAAGKGRKFSAEHRAKISEAIRQYRANKRISSTQSSNLIVVPAQSGAT
jgi:group I intron endonuclease